MTFTVIWLSQAMVAYRRIRGTDSDGARRIAGAVAALATDPYPAASSALGKTNFRRLRLDSYRVRYEVTDVAVHVMHIGRVPGR